MEQNYNTPKEVIESNINTAVGKAALPFGKMILLGILAGIFIALGGAGSNVAVHDIANVGLQRTLAGVIFPAGLIMIVLVGGELFTGNCLMTMAAWDKKIKWSGMLRNLVVVFFSNLIGALVIVLLVSFSGQFDYTGGKLGAYTISVAAKKIALSPLRMVLSGILCNVLVCVAILMAAAAKDVAGKILAIFFPIWLFVASGFEHVVANMYYIPAGILAAMNPAYVETAKELYSLTDAQLASLNALDSLPGFFFVMLGNFIGGGLVIGGLCYLTQKKVYDKEFKIQAVQLEREIGFSKAAKELGVNIDTLYGWNKRTKDDRFDLELGMQTLDAAMSLTEEVQNLRQQSSEQSKEIARLKEENEFLAEASAFFAANRQKSAKN